jgi:hypothetical protein
MGLVLSLKLLVQITFSILPCAAYLLHEHILGQHTVRLL